MRNAAFAAALLATGAVEAQTATDDVRCLFASNVFFQAEKDASKREIARIGTFFYMGRVDARTESDALKAALAEQAKSMTAQNVGPIMTDCVKRMQAKMNAMKVIGDQLQATSK